MAYPQPTKIAVNSSNATIASPPEYRNRTRSNNYCGKDRKKMHRGFSRNYGDDHYISNSRQHWLRCETSSYTRIPFAVFSSKISNLNTKLYKHLISLYIFLIHFTLHFIDLCWLSLPKRLKCKYKFKLHFKMFLYSSKSTLVKIINIICISLNFPNLKKTDSNVNFK